MAAISKFQQMMLDVEAERSTRETEQSVLTWAHFRRHPECKQKILGIGYDGMAIRSKTEQINVLARINGTWLTPLPEDIQCEIERQPEAPVQPELAYKLGKKRPVIVTQFMQQRYLPALRDSAESKFPHLRDVPKGLSAAQAAAFT